MIQIWIILNLKMASKIFIGNETGTLRRLLVHSPDIGIGRVIPSKAQEWLFEDLLHLKVLRTNQYDYYTKILLYFLDPEKIKNKVKIIDKDENRNYFKPQQKGFHGSDKVIQIQWILSQILQNKQIKSRLISAVGAFEKCNYSILNKLDALKPQNLSQTLMSGVIGKNQLIFQPIPNFVFTRDIGIVIKDHILLNRPARDARTRQALLMKYIYFNHPFFTPKNLLEIEGPTPEFLIPDQTPENKITYEGGDFMMPTDEHLIIGISERTTEFGAKQIIKSLFQKKIIKKASLVYIPKKRDYMHIDTIFTQVSRNTWALLGKFSKVGSRSKNQCEFDTMLGKPQTKQKIRIVQFDRETKKSSSYDCLQQFLTSVSRQLGASNVQFIYSGNNVFPFDERQQWTDSCNLLALKEGVVLGYDRNEQTANAFKQKGYQVRDVKSLLQSLQSGEITTEKIHKTLIMMPSGEISRARGGFRCMSNPILRQKYIE